MSAIGDYIHLRKQNYYTYGTSRLNESPNPYIESLRVQQKLNQSRLNNLRNKVDKATLEELSDRVKKNFNNSKQAREIAENRVKFNQGIQEFLDSVIDTLIKEIPSQFGLDNNIRLNTDQLYQIQQPLDVIQQAKRHRDNALSAIKTANDNFKAGKPVRKNTIDAILKQTDDFFYCLGMLEGKNIISPKTDWKNQDTLAALQKVLEQIPLYEINRSTFNGIFGETLVLMTDDKALEMSEEALKQTITKELSTGETRSTFQLTESIISESVKDIFKKETGLNLYQIRSTQNKVDASITIKGQDINASVKAYTPSGNRIYAHLQDVSLLTNLAATPLQFANHWISLHSYSNLRKEYQKAKENMDDALTAQTMYIVLSRGNLLKQDAIAADTFVAIDTVNGRVYTNSVYDILRNGKNNFILNPLISSIVIKSNKEAGSADQRIAKIIMDLHQIKIKVTYRAQLEPLI